MQLRRACRRELGWQAIDLLGDFYRTQQSSFVQVHKQVPSLARPTWLEVAVENNRPILHRTCAAIKVRRWAHVFQNNIAVFFKTIISALH